MSETQIIAAGDTAAWTVRAPGGAVGFTVSLSSRIGTSGRDVEVVEFGIAGQFGRMTAEFLTLGQDWRMLAQHYDRGYFFGKALGHEAWNVDEGELHRRLEAELRERAEDPAVADRLVEQLPEAVQLILQGRVDIVPEFAEALPDDWDETLVPRQLRPELVTLWDDYWRPFKAQMKAEWLAGVGEPGREIETAPAVEAEIEAEHEEEAVALEM